MPKLATRTVLFTLSLCFITSALHADDALRSGKIAFAKRNYKEALALFQQAKKARPADGEPYYYAGLVHERNGNKSAAMAEFRRATELTMPAELKEKAFWKVLLHLRYVGDWENLHAIAQRFLSLRANPEVEKMRDLAEANMNPAHRKIQRVLNEAAEAEKRGRLAEAASLYAEAARLDPGSTGTLWKAGDALRKLDRCSDAQRYYLRAIEVDGAAWYSFFQSGVCFYKMQRFAEAVRSFDQATRLNANPDASFRFYLQTGRGLSLLELERVDDADGALRSLRENKAMFAKSGPAAILAATLAAIRNDRGSIEPLLRRIDEQEADRPAVPVIRGIKSLLAADFVALEKGLQPLLGAKARRGRLESYTAQLLLLVAHRHALVADFDAARLALKQYHTLRLPGPLQGVLFRSALGNPLTPFLEDHPQQAAAYAKDVRLFAAHPGEAAAIIEGRILFESGETAQARPLLEKAGADPLCLLYLGIVQYDAGELPAARVSVKEALRLDPDLRRRILDRKVLLDLIESPDPSPAPSEPNR